MSWDSLKEIWLGKQVYLKLQSQTSGEAFIVLHQFRETKFLRLLEKCPKIGSRHNVN